MPAMRRTVMMAMLGLPLGPPAWALDLGMLSQTDASGGLKEALNQGAAHAVETLGREGGFMDNPKVRIALPGWLEKAEPLLRMAGRGKALDQLVLTMNRAAEAAVPEARTLLQGAVKQMTVTDARNILSGGDDSVTRFFRGKTEQELTQRLLPLVRQHTDRLAVASQYNKLAGQAAASGLLKPEDAQIEHHVTQQALDGLYQMIAEQEKTIRRNPMEAAGSLARKVFGAL
ncbi:DUF4197 domain-containing protein [Malikia sp.]|uniref:DUF4197 domain-containing protein n=1 Tax=Malikia sp. TaxID=2070706 RepID=UPI00260AEEB6|nr:DUF4197 domain-containing protein [Malikia sp.]MDD2729066.1 DUF4197 domain-containing protein [Malikia sp.]